MKIPHATFIILYNPSLTLHYKRAVLGMQY